MSFMGNEMKIGFIGIGVMGKPMAANILKSGFELMCFNRTKEKILDLKEKGALVANSIEELVEWADTILFMLTTPEIIDSILFKNINDPNIYKGKIIINMGTISPSFSTKLKEEFSKYNARYIDAPVSGSKKPAEEGKLIILTSGDRTLIDNLNPLFLTMGNKITYCGEIPKASMIKLSVNLLILHMMEGFSEMINFAKKGDIDLNSLFEIVLSSQVSNDLYRMKYKNYLLGEFPVQGSVKNGIKDLTLITQTAKETGAFIPLTNLNYEMYLQAMGLGYEDEDFSAIIKVLENNKR
ncbi:MAG: tartronate semialdehyde reductase [Candidatus Methanofastidiosum methylothiophilum]|uniref:Tartronate semialdehyde reductase n=1 Tax=Candidatus Methanofastidiosum methylothiophilum TaxID=1705564 RepID=A0A150IJ42_9EURY|nr:MAG: tartronate semialdehyde reductase [Candidatus Methanofastidiosum methylthiophilus]KYC47046.1 MAG: tartronate semialdehyde reductase [Candidatus Methanofastidiosum methylthiophilus]KYC49449.1 MAG: tartronate semialdehyde reductase [Candidatus Methanofastidiosum methylthiophilus]